MEHSAQYVAVVGGANVDIGGMPDRELIEGDSNPGRVRVSLGGVGHNIARNLSLLGVKTVFLTALGRDEYGLRIARDCEENGVDCSEILRAEDPTSTYLFITDGAGDMRLAISDMAICRRITPAWLETKKRVLEGAAAVVADANLPAETLRWIAENSVSPVFADPVSVTKAEKLRPLLGRLHTVKPNRLEAELLGGVPIRSREDLDWAADRLLETGLGRVFISLGSRGVYCADEKERLLQPCCPARAVNTTGAGDAFMAGLVWAHLRGLGLAETARAAQAAAAVAVEGAETINPALSEETLTAKTREAI